MQKRLLVKGALYLIQSKERLSKLNNVNSEQSNSSSVCVFIRASPSSVDIVGTAAHVFSARHVHVGWAPTLISGKPPCTVLI